MPLFEFVCSDCDQPFEELVMSSSSIGQVTCPACSSSHVKKQISTFASKVAGGGSFASTSFNSGSSCNTGSV
jgi:putative FmdB family regulatory protein